MNTVIQVRDIPGIVANQGHRIFTVRFNKRGDGSLRVMNCRRLVKRHLRGGEPSYDFGMKGLVNVFDLQRKDYRCFPLEGVREIRAQGRVYEVAQ